MKVISGSFTITAVEDGENAVTYEMIDNGSYYRYNPNTKKVDMQVLGTLYEIEGTKRTPMAGYQIFINDDGNIINDNANDGNYLTTKTDGSFSYTADSDWVDLLSQSTKIHAGFYANDGLVAVLNIQKITDGENGKDGENAIRVDLDNENDTMLYDGNGTLVSGAVTSQARLYDGSEEKTDDAKWEISGASGTGNYTVEITDAGFVTVDGITDKVAYIQVKAEYPKDSGNYYYTQLTIKKLVNADKYELVVTPNAIAYNETTDSADKTENINIKVYKTDVTGNRSLSNPPNGYYISVYTDNTLTGNITASEYDITVTPSECNNIRIAINGGDGDDSMVLDSETVPINKSKDGQSGESAVNVTISPQNIVAKKSVGYQTYSFDVSVVKGGAKIKQGEWTVDFKVNGVYSGNDVIDGVLYFDHVTLKDDYTLHYEFILYTESIADTNLTFSVNYEGVIYPQTVCFQTLVEPEIYEIIPSSAYFTQSGEGWVNGGFEGQLVKVVGKDRYGIEGATVEMVYTDNNGSIYVEETKETDSQGYFAFTDQIDGGWEDYGYTNAFSVRYVINQEIVAERTVSLAKSGMKGERGAPLRISYWADGWTYYTGKNANDPYTDVVIVGDNYYLCMSNHTATSSNKPVDGSTDKTYWQKSSKIDMVATEVLLADNAHINLLSSNGINVNDSSGNPTAGLSGGDGVQLWGGGERETAKFRVYDDGDVFVEGTVKATNFYHGLKYVYGGGNTPYIENEDVVVINDGGWTSEQYEEANKIYIDIPKNHTGKLLTVYNQCTSSTSQKPWLSCYNIETGTFGKFLPDNGDNSYDLSGKNKVVFIAEKTGNNHYWTVLEYTSKTS